jgi:hypothetical protein
VVRRSAFFVVTYPLNTAADAMVYVSMILHHKANLVFLFPRIPAGAEPVAVS